MGKANRAAEHGRFVQQQFEQCQYQCYQRRAVAKLPEELHRGKSPGVDGVAGGKVFAPRPPQGRRRLLRGLIR
jgi:hypothetical protein